MNEETKTGLLAKPQFLILFALIISAFLLSQLLLFQYGRDQGIYAVVADSLVHGGVPYRDAWDFKPPGVFFIYALARWIFSGSMVSIRLLEAIGFISLVYAFVILSKRHLGSAFPGILGGAFAILSHVRLEFWHTAQPESFGAVALSWALVCSTYSPTPDDHGAPLKQNLSWIGAGVLFAIAALLKPPLGGGILTSLALVIFRRIRGSKHRRAWASAVAPCLAFGLGAGLVLALTFSFFAAHGALGDLYRVFFIFVPSYTRLAAQSGGFLNHLFLAFYKWLVTFSPLFFLGLPLLFFLPSIHPREKEGTLHIIGCLGFQLIGVALQAKFFAYHFGAALPLTGLLAGWGFTKLFCRSRIKGLMSLALIFLVLAQFGIRPSWNPPDSLAERSIIRITSLFANPEQKIAADDDLSSMQDVNAGANRLVAEWIAGRTSPNSRIFIWGFEPVIYDLSNRRPASRYIHNLPQRLQRTKRLSRDILIQDLKASSPAVIVIESRDVFPLVTGNARDSTAELANFSELSGLLSEQYQRSAAIEDFTIYIRIGATDRPNFKTIF